MPKKENRGISFYFLTLYVFLIFCIYPLYFENGYYNMGDAKCRFFFGTSVIAFFTIFVTNVLDMVLQKKRIGEMTSFQKGSITEKLLCVYIVSVFLSYIFSDFKKDVLWGAEGWYLGTIPLLLMAVLSFFLMYRWEKQEWLKAGFLIVSSVVFILGICNRFSFYPIPMEPHQGAFISTLGNINWLCGYMSVVSPVGIGLFMFTEDKKYKYPWQKGFLVFYVMLVFILGFCQGSNSVFLWNGALFLVLFWISLRKIVFLKKWLLLIAMWGISGQLVRIFVRIFPEKYSYDSTLLVDTNITWIMALIAVCLYVRLKFYQKKEIEFFCAYGNRIAGMITAGLVIVFLFWLILAVYNTNVGISFLAGKPLFLLNDSWGNGRGIIFKTTFEMFENMTPMQKLFGVGADGYSVFAYSIGEIEIALKNYFGDTVLTNAHCEILTNFINLGILGTVAYAGIFITFIVRCMKTGEKVPYAYIPALCVIGYFSNNFISFAQVLNTPYLFLILGMGESYLKKNES